MDVIKSQQISARPVEKVIVHPLVLLSIVDNYNRVAKDTRKRVVGVLLGSSFKGTVDVTNSYAGSVLYFFRPNSIFVAFRSEVLLEILYLLFGLLSMKFLVLVLCLANQSQRHEVVIYEEFEMGNVFFEELRRKEHDKTINVSETRNSKKAARLANSRLHLGPVPFEEDDKDPSIWFLDHNYHEAMFSMFKRINAKEHVVGWYSTGPKLRENDLDIHGLFNDYVPNPVLVIIDVQPKELGIPTKAYYAVEEVKENATQKSQKVFVHVTSEIAAHEVEEIGVEHLLRDVKDTTISTLATEVTGKLAALKGLDARLREIRGYLDLVVDGKLPLNHEILYHLQDVFNLLPNLNVADLIKAFAVKTNDQMLVIYLSSLIRSVIALHNLINNKMLNKEHEKAEDAKPATVPPVGGS
ncbi:hypothetical protein RJ640_018377 [Escallonia rubra]|uniref:JAB1/MPN/MOV34 metalloenzyme domain-containing protein n=1 Tax=Escallonia rubra TaxID=112253 RepID=A0AA88Q9G4_9ASTE|nr:hypothetical protein RJ640_018377 [Escallonia rubra]